MLRRKVSSSLALFVFPRADCWTHTRGEDCKGKNDPQQDRHSCTPSTSPVFEHNAISANPFPDLTLHEPLHNQPTTVLAQDICVLDAAMDHRVVWLTQELLGRASVFSTQMSGISSKHICPHCGAVYQMTERGRCRRPTYHTAACSFCGDVMAEWRGCARHYHRIKRPRPLAHARKIVAQAAVGNSRTGTTRRRSAALTSRRNRRALKRAS